MRRLSLRRRARPRRPEPKHRRPTKLPIFDAHLHYSQPAWAAHPPEAVIAALRAAGVPRALVSSTPDDGSLALARADPRRFVPMLRPYRGEVGSSNWTSDPELAAYLETRLAAGRYAGIGEFHVFDPAHVASPRMKRVVELALERDLYIHIHSDARPVRALFLAHPRRFLIGTDTYVTSRWDGYGEIVEEHRRYLAQLPRETAEAIAWRNAARAFGAGEAPELRD